MKTAVVFGCPDRALLLGDRVQGSGDILTGISLLCFSYPSWQLPFTIYICYLLGYMWALFKPAQILGSRGSVQGSVSNSIIFGYSMPESSSRCRITTSTSSTFIPRFQTLTDYGYPSTPSGSSYTASRPSVGTAPLVPRGHKWPSERNSRHYSVNMLNFLVNSIHREVHHIWNEINQTRNVLRAQINDIDDVIQTWRTLHPDFFGPPLH